MAYQSQLVVRTKDPRRAEIIERVKERANEQGVTYSEMALELLERGLQADAGQLEVAPEPEAAHEPATRVADETAADGGSASAAPPEVTDASSPGSSQDAPEAGAEPSEPIPDVELPDDDSAEAIVGACVKYLEESGRRAATQVLAEFFATAGPAEGGQVKDELQSRVEAADYEAILEALRDTEQYREYRQRVIFGS